MTFDATMIDVSTESNEYPIEEMPPRTNRQDEYSVEFMEFSENCKPLLEECFPRGFRLDSPLECKRFHNFWEQRYGMQKEISDNEMQ